MSMLTDMVSQNKHAKLTLLKILIISPAPIFKDAKTALPLQVPSLETKATVGLSQNIQSGKWVNMARFRVLIK